MRRNLPEIREQVNCGEKRLTWFKRGQQTVWLAAEGKGAGDITGEILRRLEEHS